MSQQRVDKTLHLIDRFPAWMDRLTRPGQAENCWQHQEAVLLRTRMFTIPPGVQAAGGPGTRHQFRSFITKERTAFNQMHCSFAQFFDRFHIGANVSLGLFALTANELFDPFFVLLDLSLATSHFKIKERTTLFAGGSKMSEGHCVQKLHQVGPSGDKSFLRSGS
jgi:hypothetical protein